mgnify:CR=1 FL=1
MELIQSLAQALDELDEDKAVSLVRTAIEQKMDLLKVLQEGVMAGLASVNKKIDSKEYFLAEMIAAGETAKRCMELINPHLSKSSTVSLGRVVIGVAKDDMHEMGKNLVVAQLRISGFDVVDLGTDVPTIQFIEKAEETGANIIGMSAFLSTTTPNFTELINYLKDSGLRQKYKVIVGGGTTTERFAQFMGADGWAPNAVKATELCKSLVASPGGVR